MTNLNDTPLSVYVPGSNKKRSNKKPLFVLFLILLLPIYLIIRQTPKESQPVVNEAKTEKKIESIFTPVTPHSTLKEIVDKALDGSKATYAVSINNLKTGESFYLNEHKKFLTASLYKVWVMVVVYDQIQKGRLKENDVLKQDVKILNDEFEIASEDAELNDGTIELRVNDALNKMITVSDNYASLLLTEKIGVSSLKDFLVKNGFNESTVNQPPTTTAFDMNLFFKKLYRIELADKESTEKMLNLLKNQSFKDILPKYLSKDVVIAHKTGQLYTVAHDAGIVYTDKGDYIITLLSDSFDIVGAKERMAKISEGVYAYFSQI